MMAGVVMIDELTKTVARTAQLTPDQATLAVKAMLRFFTARLPSRLVGELYAFLKVPRTGSSAASGHVISLPAEPDQ